MRGFFFFFKVSQSKSKGFCIWKFTSPLVLANRKMVKLHLKLIHRKILLYHLKTTHCQKERCSPIQVQSAFETGSTFWFSTWLGLDLNSYPFIYGSNLHYKKCILFSDGKLKVCPK